MIGLHVTLHAIDRRTGAASVVHGVIRGEAVVCGEALVIIEFIDGADDGQFIHLPRAMCINPETLDDDAGEEWKEQA